VRKLPSGIQIYEHAGGQTVSHPSVRAKWREHRTHAQRPASACNWTWTWTSKSAEQGVRVEEESAEFGNDVSLRDCIRANAFTSSGHRTVLLHFCLLIVRSRCVPVQPCGYWELSPRAWGPLDQRSPVGRPQFTVPVDPSSSRRMRLPLHARAAHLSPIPSLQDAALAGPK
jgi:hypothetical protein